MGVEAADKLQHIHIPIYVCLYLCAHACVYLYTHLNTYGRKKAFADSVCSVYIIIK